MKLKFLKNINHLVIYLFFIYTRYYFMNKSKFVNPGWVFVYKLIEKLGILT
jgi:hypothetical protein